MVLFKDPSEVLPIRICPSVYVIYPVPPSLNLIQSSAVYSANEVGFPSPSNKAFKGVFAAIWNYSPVSVPIVTT